MTHVQLRDRLGDWLATNAKRIPQSVRTDILNMVQRELCRAHDLRYNEFVDSFDTTTGANAYPLPAAWSRPYELWYIDPDSRGVVFVKFLLLDEFDNRYPDPTATARPQHFTLWGDLLYLGPTPDLNVTVNRTYYGYVPDLVADTDHNGFTDQAWDLMLFKGLASLTRYGIEDDRIPTWESKAAELEGDLVREHARAKSMGRRPVGQEPG